MIRIARAEVIEIKGRDAIAFAHSQFASDVRGLALDEWQWSTWLDAQGRARHVFALLHPEAERLVIWQPLGNAGEMATQLKRYVLRAKVQIAPMEDWHLFDASDHGGGNSPTGLSHAHDGWIFQLPGPSERSALLAPNQPDLFDPGDDKAIAAWSRADIAALMPWVSNETSGQWVAPALGLQRLGAIRLDKGCYPGQEIVARLHYRGGNKRHCHRLLIHDTTPPSPGSTIVSTNGESAPGTILYSTTSMDGGSEALAVLPESLAATGNLQLASGARVEIIASAADQPPTT